MKKLKYINGWNKQKVIDLINKDFIGKAVDINTGSCYYRGPNNKKCIAGLFMSDEQSEAFENQSACYVGQNHPDIFPFDNDIMVMYQGIHDNLDPNDSLETQKKILISFLG